MWLVFCLKSALRRVQRDILICWINRENTISASLVSPCYLSLLWGTQLFRGNFISSLLILVDTPWLKSNSLVSDFSSNTYTHTHTTVAKQWNEWHLQLRFPCGGYPIDHNWHLLKHSLAEKYLLILSPSKMPTNVPEAGKKAPRIISSLHCPTTTLLC